MSSFLGKTPLPALLRASHRYQHSWKQWLGFLCLSTRRNSGMSVSDVGVTTHSTKTTRTRNRSAARVSLTRLYHASNPVAFVNATGATMALSDARTVSGSSCVTTRSWRLPRRWEACIATSFGAIRLTTLTTRAPDLNLLTSIPGQRCTTPTWCCRPGSSSSVW